MNPFPRLHKTKDKAAQKFGFTKKFKPTGLDIVKSNLFAKSWAERVDGVEGWAPTETCLESCSSVRATGFSNSGIFKDRSRK